MSGVEGRFSSRTESTLSPLLSRCVWMIGSMFRELCPSSVHPSRVTQTQGEYSWLSPGCGQSTDDTRTATGPTPYTDPQTTRGTVHGRDLHFSDPVIEIRQSTPDRQFVPRP